jgi:hypothetical protein
MDNPNGSVIARFMEAVERGDLDTMVSLAHEEIVMEWLQSGKRFRGRDNALASVRDRK